MARKRRPSPTDKEIERIAESIFNLDVADEIQDRDSFDEAFDNYFEEDSDMKKNPFVRDKSFKDIRILNPNISPISTKKEPREPKPISPKKIKVKRDYNIAGRVKQKVVFTSKEEVSIKGNLHVRHRAKNGRFASIKKK